MGKSRRILLRSSWQTVNIGDIAHTPGMLSLLEKHCPHDAVTLWPNRLTPEVEHLLLARFPKLQIAGTPAEQDAALESCDFFLHGSGPSLVGARATEQAQKAGKPYGIAGITLDAAQIEAGRAILSGAKFLFTRDSISLEALKKSEMSGPKMDFGPDATFALDLRDDKAAARLLAEHGLEADKFLCAVPRLRYTPYWEIRENVQPNPERIAINEKFAETDHAKQREAIVAWVRETGMRVFLVPEMTYEVPLLRPLLFNPLPADVKPFVAVLDRYWLTAEAASVYAHAAAVLSQEMHSPIMAVSSGIPAILMRHPTDTSKGQMWRDIGLDAWIFEIDQSSGAQIAAQIAARIVEIGRDLPRARQHAVKARNYAHQKMEAMILAMN